MLFLKARRQRLAVIVVLILIFSLSVFVLQREEYTPVDPEEEHEVELFFSTSDGMYLDTEVRTIPGEDFYLQVLQELIEGPESDELGPTMPEDSEVISLEHDSGDERLVVNFNEDWQLNHWGGSTGERLTIYSAVNTLSLLPGVSEVGFEIEGEEVSSLAGHLDLTASYEFSEDIVRQDEPESRDNEEYDIEIEDTEENSL
ncbi:GerMN domain-containing protein [Halarsenatibacter silvermanii]|uniref:Sporulation and spore germination n=1 Tax=Halarsenatibacter silvermanii TaxID=321763 RepID=A0A1G9QJV5_9FIRM|nr:GerMN domain-containing protein [Halarsenatibacter silvermanii]SDM11278.1 Sporulation and spore germination [Halarsenatibacter silvermanii]